jgi:hypothetical protein
MKGPRERWTGEVYQLTRSRAAGAACEQLDPMARRGEAL